MFAFVIDHRFSGIDLYQKSAISMPYILAPSFSGTLMNALMPFLLHQSSNPCSVDTARLGAGLDIFQRCYQARMPQPSGKHGVLT